MTESRTILLCVFGRWADVPETGVAMSPRGGHWSFPCPLSRATAVLEGASHATGRGGKERHRPHQHPVLSLAASRRGASSALPGLPSLPRWRGSPAQASVKGVGLGTTTTLGTPVRGWGVSCRRGCCAGGGLAIPSTGCIIKKSLRAGGQSPAPAQSGRGHCHGAPPPTASPRKNPTC